jgi:hypothetical protein
MRPKTEGQDTDDTLGDWTYRETIDDETSSIRVRGRVDRLGVDLLRATIEELDRRGHADITVMIERPGSVDSLATPSPRGDRRTPCRPQRPSDDQLGRGRRTVFEPRPRLAMSDDCRVRRTGNATTAETSASAGCVSNRPASNVRKGRRHMATSIDIETQGEHRYVVQLRDDDEVTESWFNITPSVLERLRAGGEDEEHFVRRTAEFLVQRQGVADFPDIIELEDVIETYSDYVEYLNR